MNTLKDAVILSGRIYMVRRITYISGLSPNPCDKCELRKRCEAKNLQPCKMFDKGNRLAYFKLKAKQTKNSIV